MLRVAASIFLLYLTIVVFATVALVIDRQDDTRTAETKAEMLADIAFEHVRQVFMSVDLGFSAVSDDIGDAYQPDGSFDPIPREIFRNILLLLPSLRGIGFIDDQGYLRANASGIVPPDLRFDDRDYFQTLKTNDQTSSLWIGTPIISRPDNQISIPIARRVSKPEGQFLGVVAARLDPTYLERFFAALGADAVALTKTDGSIIVRYPVTPDQPSAPLAVLGPDVRGRRVDAHFVSSVDGVTRITAARSMDGLPLVISVGLDRTAVLSAWRMRRDITVVSVLLLGAAGLLLVRLIHLRQKARIQEIEAASERRIVEAARDVAIETSNKKTEFLAHMSHELRTPLNAIIGFSQMMESETLGPHQQPRYKEYAADILFSAEHLLAVINNILDLARVEAGRWAINEQPTSVRSLLADVHRLATNRADREGVSVIIDNQLGAGRLLCDRRAMVQALLNLVVNAISFSGENRAVRLEAGLDRDGVLFRVIDQGAGMSPEDAVRVLRPFETVAHDNARKRHDTGLGLPLARAFAELHGGTLTLISSLGTGTAATIKLPVARYHPAPSAADAV